MTRRSKLIAVQSLGGSSEPSPRLFIIILAQLELARSSRQRAAIKQAQKGKLEMSGAFIRNQMPQPRGGGDLGEAQEGMEGTCLRAQPRLGQDCLLLAS